MNRKLFMTGRNINFMGLKAIFTGMFLVMACSAVYAQDADVYTVAEMPFIRGENPENVDETLNCPFANICFENQNVLPGAEKTLTLMLYKILSGRLGEKLTPMDKVDRIYETMKINYATDTPATFAQALGKGLNVKYVVVGNVWRYKNRTGNALATEHPSSVAFSIYLIDVENHELAWSATYDETQRPLTENLLNIIDFFKQGAKWLTVDELAEYGMKKILKTFPVVP